MWLDYRVWLGYWVGCGWAIENVCLHDLKPFDPRKAETPGIEMFETIYFE